jgi:hypothetical protein
MGDSQSVGASLSLPGEMPKAGLSMTHAPNSLSRRVSSSIVQEVRLGVPGAAPKMSRSKMAERINRGCEPPCTCIATLTLENTPHFLQRFRSWRNSFSGIAHGLPFRSDATDPFTIAAERSILGVAHRYAFGVQKDPLGRGTVGGNHRTDARQ